MRKILILTVVALSVFSCASVRRATPIAAEDIKTYPTSKAEEKKVEKKVDEASADIQKPAPQEEPKTRKEVAKPLSQQVIDYARTYTGVPYKLGVLWQTGQCPQYRPCGYCGVCQ